MPNAERERAMAVLSDAFWYLHLRSKVLLFSRDVADRKWDDLREAEDILLDAEEQVRHPRRRAQLPQGGCPNCGDPACDDTCTDSRSVGDPDGSYAARYG